MKTGKYGHPIRSEHREDRWWVNIARDVNRSISHLESKGFFRDERPKRRNLQYRNP